MGVCEVSGDTLTHARVLEPEGSGFAHFLGDDRAERDEHQEQ